MIIGFDSPNEVLDAVDSFQSLPGRPEVLVLENGSARYPKNTNVSYLERNIGYCGAANVAIAFGLSNGYSAVTIANWDVRVKPESFVALQKEVKSCTTDVAIIGGIELDGAGKVTTAGGANWSRWTGKDRWLKSVPLKPTNVLFVQGAFVTFTPAIAALTPVFDERLFMFFDEIDLGLRLRKAGLVAMLAPSVKYVHKNQDSRYRPLRGYLMWRNRSLVSREHGGRVAPVAIAWGLVMLVVGVISRLPNFKYPYTVASFKGWFDGARGIRDLHRVPTIKYIAQKCSD